MKSCLLYTLAQPNKQDPSNRNNFKIKRICAAI